MHSRRARRGVELYRQRFNAIGIFENSVYPGVVDALTTFEAAGHRMQVVTAKPAIAARRVLEHFGLARFFAAVHGPGLTDRTCDKGALVAAALKGVHEHARPIVMVGDRADDIVAARRNGVRCVAAGWGCGTRDELLAASPDYFASAVADAVAWLQTLGRQPGQRTIWRPDAGAGTGMLDV